MSNVVSIKGAQQPPRAEQSRMDTLIITRAMVDVWRLPPFQRPVKTNAKVLAVMELIKRTETIEGVVTLGALKGKAGELYIVDGQHRIEAFKLAGIDAAIVDVRVMIFNDMGEMADEFVRLNSALVAMKPDDILRGLESTTPALREIRTACPFIGYNRIRWNPDAPIISMSVALRSWRSASFDTPGQHGGMSAGELAKSIDVMSTKNLITIMSVVYSAWGSDQENHRLWGALNLTLCMWLWLRLVTDRDRFGNKRYVVLDIPEFKKCLMSVSADADWSAWLPGRRLSDRDRSPAYNRLKTIFVRRLQDIRPGQKIQLPQPSWAVSR